MNKTPETPATEDLAKPHSCMYMASGSNTCNILDYKRYFPEVPPEAEYGLLGLNLWLHSGAAAHENDWSYRVRPEAVVGHALFDRCVLVTQHHDLGSL